MLFADPPDHTRMRKLVAKVFTPRRVEELRPTVQRLVDATLDPIVDRGEMDLIGELAFPLPFTVISEMLGMPDADRDQLREWSGKMVKMLDPIMSPEDAREAMVAGEHMFGHVGEVIEWKRSHLADDLLSAMITAEEDGDTLTTQELIDNVGLLFVAGHETTVNLIGNGMLALAASPRPARRVARRPGARRQRGRRAASLRQPGAVLASHRHQAAVDRRGHDRTRHVRDDVPRFGQP